MQITAGRVVLTNSLRDWKDIVPLGTKILYYRTVTAMAEVSAADNRPPLHNAMMSMGNQHAGEGILSNSVYENRGGVAMREAKKMAVR